jgi:hypothetical protein
MRLHLTNMRLFGAGTNAGNCLGDEPSGFAYHVESGELLIRDATGAKNWLGQFSAKAGGSSDYLATTDLPFLKAQGTIWATASHSGAALDRLFEMANTSNFINAQIAYGRNSGNVINLVTRSNGGLENNLNGTATSSTKHAMRWAANDVKTYINGVADLTSATLTTPSLEYDRIYIFKDRGAANPWLGSKTSICWVPRAMSDAELAARSS